MTDRFISDRYAVLFRRLADRGEGAFIPFLMLGDPTPELSRRLIEAAIAGGADALELGIPFSDPIADGPTLQTAAQRALAAGVTPDTCFALLRDVRDAHPELPLGLLVYANLVVGGGLDAFYERAALAGVDSVLVADVPSFEVQPFAARARHHGIAPVLIAPPNADEERLAIVAQLSKGYTYVATRAGVTGRRDRLELNGAGIPGRLRELRAAPPVLGFGISRAEHVRAAMQAGGAGAISGSALVEHVARYVSEGGAPELLLAAVRGFVSEMKAATLAD